MGDAKKAYCPHCGHSKLSKRNDRTQSGAERFHCLTCKRRCNGNTILTDPEKAKKLRNGEKDAAEIKVEPPKTLEQLSVEEQLRRELKGLKVQVKELTNEAIDTTRLRKLIHGAAEHDPKPPEWLVDHKPVGTFGTPTLFLSDLHWGETVFSAQVNDTNEYNLPIARQRLERVFTTTVRLLRDYLADGDYAGIVVALGGDMLSGNIHDEIRETNDDHVLACLLDLQDHLIAGIDMLAEEFGRVFIPCVVGNHGRLDRKPRAKGAVRDNFEWILYHNLARHFQDDESVCVIVSESLDYVYRVHNTRYLLTHGDQFRGGTGISGPILPWTLGDHRKRKRQDAIQQPYDVMIFGHWHTLFWGGGSFIANGSLKGYDEYAYRFNLSFQPAMQALWVTHPSKGITFQMPVLADQTAKAEEKEWVSILAQ